MISDPDYEKNIYIKKSDAVFRADYIDTVSYDVSLGLPLGIYLCLIYSGDAYYGRIVVKMTLKKLPTSKLFLDFRGVAINHYTVNGTQVTDPAAFKEHKVYIPSASLLGEGQENIVTFYLINQIRSRCSFTTSTGKMVAVCTLSLMPRTM